MKAQFKYAFLAGLYNRGIVFAVILALDVVFIALASLGLLPFAARITAVSLGGVSIAVMMVCNIIGDVAVIRRMFSSPGAYLHALTPAPRRQILLSSVLAIAAMDFVTMAAVIFGEVWLTFLMARDNIGAIVWDAFRSNTFGVLYGLLSILFLISGYLLVMMIVLFCVAAKKSMFYQKPAGGLLTALLAGAAIYIVSLSRIILAPFGSVSRFGLLFTVFIGGAGAIAYVLLTLIQVAALFFLTARLMERRINL